MSWDDEEFVADLAVMAEGGPVVEEKKPKKLSLEAAAYEKREAKAMEEKALLEAAVVEAKAAVEKARAEAKNTAASKAYVASLEKKVAAAEAAVANKVKAIHEADVAEGKRQMCKKNAKKGVKEFDYERDYLGVVRDEMTGKVMYYLRT